MIKQYINLSIAKGSLLLIFQFCIHLMNVHFLGFFTSWIRICPRGSRRPFLMRIRNTNQNRHRMTPINSSITRKAPILPLAEKNFAQKITTLHDNLSFAHRYTGIKMVICYLNLKIRNLAPIHLWKW